MDKCEYEVRIRDFPYSCCKAQKHCPPVLCPTNYKECPVYKQKYNTNKNVELKNKN